MLFDMMRPTVRLCLLLAFVSFHESESYSSLVTVRMSGKISRTDSNTRRSFFSKAATLASATSFLSTTTSFVRPASAVGPVRVDLINPTYFAEPCPKNRPIPGEKAMKGMRGLCVTVNADLKEAAPKQLDEVGVYGFVTDAVMGDSVLANNPDLSTDAGQFAIIPKITPETKKVTFDFVAAVPMEKNITEFENGIGELNFKSLRVVSFPGGQQYGGISPCEMNEFSDECEVWEEENGPYVKKDFMVKSNERTKGR